MYYDDRIIYTPYNINSCPLGYTTSFSLFYPGRIYN